MFRFFSCHRSFANQLLTRCSSLHDSRIMIRCTLLRFDSCFTGGFQADYFVACFTHHASLRLKPLCFTFHEKMSHFALPSRLTCRSSHFVAHSSCFVLRFALGRKRFAASVLHRAPSDQCRKIGRSAFFNQGSAPSVQNEVVSIQHLAA